jgi:hypothetical protein
MTKPVRQERNGLTPKRSLVQFQYRAPVWPQDHLTSVDIETRQCLRQELNKPGTDWPLIRASLAGGLVPVVTCRATCQGQEPGAPEDRSSPAIWGGPPYGV